VLKILKNNNKFNKNFFFYFKILLILSLIYLFFNKFNFIEVLLILNELNYLAVLSLFSILIIIHILKTIRLNIVMRNYNFKETLEFFSKITLFNGIISFRTGDLYFLYKLKNSSNKINKKTIEYIKIYIKDLLIIFLLLLFTLNLDTSIYELVNFAYNKFIINLILLIFAIILIICIVSSYVFNSLLNFIVRIINKIKFFKNLNLEIYNPKKIFDFNINISLISVLIAFFYLFSIYITLNVFFNNENNIIISILIYCFVNIGRIIINVPANIVVFHYIAYMLLNIYNYDSIKSASFVIFFNFITIIVILFMGFISLLINKIK